MATVSFEPKDFWNFDKTFARIITYSLDQFLKNVDHENQIEIDPDLRKDVEWLIEYFNDYRHYPESEQEHSDYVNAFEKFRRVFPQLWT